MARSYRKTPVHPMCCCNSCKGYREASNRALRRVINQRIAAGLVEDTIDLPHKQEYGDEWSSPRDGKSWFGHWLECGRHPSYREEEGTLLEWHMKFMRK